MAQAIADSSRTGSENDPFSTLPFVTYIHGQDHYDFWDIRGTGNRGLDRDLGQRLADDTISYIVETRRAGVLSEIVMAMVGHGHCADLEMAFWDRIGGTLFPAFRS